MTTCAVCSAEIVRTPGQIRNGFHPKTCGGKCWRQLVSRRLIGHVVTEQNRAALSKSLKARGSPMTGRKHSRAAKAKMRAAALGRELSVETRIKLSEHFKQKYASEPHPMRVIFTPDLRTPAQLARRTRAKKRFTKLQRKRLLKSACEQCGSADKLELDHIIPVFANGTSEDTNAQTLCKKCNMAKLWKDAAIYRAFIKGATR